MLHVDPDLIAYGAQVSSALRGLSNNSRAALSQQQFQKMNAVEALTSVPVTYGAAYGGGGYANPYYGGGWGWGYGVTVPQSVIANNYGTVNNLMAITAGNEAAVRRETLKNIADATTQMRQKMTQKYQVEF
jgi:hypothetical protein